MYPLALLPAQLALIQHGAALLAAPPPPFSLMEGKINPKRRRDDDPWIAKCWAIDKDDKAPAKRVRAIESSSTAERLQMCIDQLRSSHRFLAARMAVEEALASS